MYRFLLASVCIIIAFIMLVAYIGFRNSNTVEISQPDVPSSEREKEPQMFYPCIDDSGNDIPCKG